ncbi:hypothetical protein D3C76_1326700 [compost metagenome]
MHLVPGRRAAQVSQASATDQQVRRIRVIQRWQDAQLRQQSSIVVADAEPQALHLLLQIEACFDRCQRQVANRACLTNFQDLRPLDHADTALAVTQFELNQTHDFSPVTNLKSNEGPRGSEPAREEVITSNLSVG